MFEKESVMIQKDMTSLHMAGLFVLGKTVIDGVDFDIDIIEKRVSELVWETKDGVSSSVERFHSVWYFRLSWGDIEGMISQRFPCPEWLIEMAEQVILES